MQLKPGSRWKSAVCTAEVVVVRSPGAPASLECGGAPMIAASAERPSAGAEVAPAHAAGSLLGKRYADAESGLEALCAKAGAGSLSVDGRPMAVRDAKKLPSSD
jgi:hypothetical protein